MEMIYQVQKEFCNQNLEYRNQLTEWKKLKNLKT